jgi:diguanylate cyclase (GGDEF)-like protein
VDLNWVRELLAKGAAEALVLAREALDSAVDPRAQAAALYVIGEAEYREGRPNEAYSPLARARDLLDSEEDRPSLTRVLLVLARVERDLARLDQATESTDEALSLARALGDAKAECEALNLRAGVMSASGEHVLAIESLEAALSLARELKLTAQEANILSNLGNLSRQLGDYPRALDSLKAAYELMRSTAPGGRGEAVNLINLGHLYREMGDDATAEEFFSRAREVGRSANDAMVEAASLNSLAIVRSKAGDWEAAGALYGEALEVARRNGLRQYEIDNLDGLGQVHAALGKYEAARRAHQSALAIARETSDSEGEIDALLNLGRDYLAMERVAEALAALESGLELAESQGRKRSLYEAHELLAKAYAREGRFEDAFRHHQEFYLAEKVVFNEESEERVRRLTVQFDLERARHEAETYRVRTEVAQQARHQAEAMVSARTRELEEAQQEIIGRLAIAGEYRDDGTGEHTRRVGRNAAAIARALGWPDEEADLLFSAARLHDVGKIGIRDSVLLKPGKLSDEEFELMREHTIIGGRILSGGRSRLLRMAEEIAFAHHERWDGKGYPMGLSGDQIPVSARIVSVADVLDALTHARPYKEAWPVPTALAEIERSAGSQFDPNVVSACLEVFRGEGALSPNEDVPATTIETQEDVDGLGEPLDWGGRPTRVLELDEVRRDAEIAARRMQLVSFSDTLSGLGNRRAFEEDLGAEVERVTRDGQRLAVLTIDLDVLRQVNDSEGPERGDALLRLFAGAVHLSLQGVGRVYRLAGDRFGAILTKVTRDGANDVLDRVQDAVTAVRESGFPTAFASAGLALLPDEAETMADLLGLIDQRLHRDKLERRSTRPPIVTSGVG